MLLSVLLCCLLLLRAIACFENIVVRERAGLFCFAPLGRAAAVAASAFAAAAVPHLLVDLPLLLRLSRSSVFCSLRTP